MKRNNKKGFTIVELVIVIAVIAILAGVLIPTFSNLITKANESKALQEANAALKTVMIDDAVNGELTEDSYSEGGYTFTFENGKLTGVVDEDNEYTFTVDASGTITAAKKASGANAETESTTT